MTDKQKEEMLKFYEARRKLHARQKAARRQSVRDHAENRLDEIEDERMTETEKFVIALALFAAFEAQDFKTAEKICDEQFRIDDLVKEQGDLDEPDEIDIDDPDSDGLEPDEREDRDDIDDNEDNLDDDRLDDSEREDTED